eukprot:4161735-Pyramimonas_sp.AAC.1
MGKASRAWEPMKKSYSLPLQVGRPGAKMVAATRSSQPISMISSGSRFQSPPSKNGKRCAPRKALRNSNNSRFSPLGPIESTP